jgi:hypothetical protein
MAFTADLVFEERQPESSSSSDIAVVTAGLESRNQK